MIDSRSSADGVLDLVCGYPEPRRSSTLLLMLKAYVDDSRSNTQPVFVLAGFLADTKKWIRFSDEWQRVLDQRPYIEYFKFNEAIKLNGQFRDWSEKRRDARLKALSDVISAHVDGFFTITINPNDLLKVYGEAYGEKYYYAANPFYFCEAALTTTVARSLEKFGLDRQQVDFIFDDQVMEKSKVVMGWEFAVKHARPDPPDLLKIIPNSPVFADDKKVLPLQAADFIAGWQRYSVARELSALPMFEPPGWAKGAKRRIPGVHIHFDENQIRERLSIEQEFYDSDRFK